MNPVLTGDEMERQILHELEEAQHAVQNAIIKQLLPWTSVGRLYLIEAERDARADVKELRRQLDYVRMRAKPAPPPKPALRAPVQLELFAGMPPLPARGPPRRKRARR